MLCNLPAMQRAMVEPRKITTYRMGGAFDAGNVWV